MTEHKIITEPHDFQSPSGDSRRVLMKMPTGTAAVQPTTNYYQAQVLNLDEYGRLRLGSRNEAINFPNIFYTATGAFSVTSPNWNSSPWNFIGCATGVAQYGGWQIPADGYYEVEMAGHAFCSGGVITSFGTACRVDQGGVVVYNGTGDSYMSAAAGAAVQHTIIRYNNTILLTPSIWGFANVYPAFIGTTNPAAQNIFIDGCHFTLRMLSAARTY